MGALTGVDALEKAKCCAYARIRIPDHPEHSRVTTLTRTESRTGRYKALFSEIIILWIFKEGVLLSAEKKNSEWPPSLLVEQNKRTHLCL